MINKNVITVLLSSVFATLAGCGSPSLDHSTKLSAQEASKKAEQVLQVSKRSFDDSFANENQEVAAPYLTGHSVPLNRNVNLPAALQKNTKTAVKFPGSWINITQFAERIMIATGIVVSVSPDAFIDPALLLPKNSTGDDTGSKQALPVGGGIPQKNGNQDLVVVKDGESIRSGSGNSAKETVNGFDFPATESQISDTLDIVCIRLGLHWKYDEATNSIRIYRLVTKSWQTPFTTANNSYNTNFEGSTNSSSSSKSLSKGSDAAPISTKSSDINELYSLRDSLNIVMSKAGSSYANPATGTITMVDTEQAVQAASQIIEPDIKNLSRTVLLRVQTIEVTENDEGDVSVDFTGLVNKVLNSIPNLSFTSASPTSVVSNTSVGSLGVGLFSGAANGSSALIQGLMEIGTVHIGTEIPLRTRNRKALYWNTRDKFNYADGTTPGTAAPGGIGGVPGISTAQDTVGLKLMVFPAVTSKDTVNVSFTMDNSNLKGIDVFTSGVGPNQQSAQLPRTNASGGVQETPVRNGQTIILTGYDRTTNTNTRRTMGEDLPLIAGGSKTSSKQRTVTLVLLSAQISDGD